MAAFREAVKQGVRAIETDFHETRDVEFFSMHDPKVDRMTDGHGEIKELTSDQMRQLRIGGQHVVPSADDICSFVKQENLYLDWEVKCPQNEGLADRIAAKLRQHGIERQTVVTADDPEFLQKMKGVLPEAPTGLVMRAKPLYKPTAYLAAGAAVVGGVAAFMTGVPIVAGVVGGLVAGGAAAFHCIKRHLQNKGLNQGSDHLMPHWLLVDRHLVDRAAAQGREVVPYGVNSEGRGERLKRLGVHGLITDYPNKFSDDRSGRRV